MAEPPAVAILIIEAGPSRVGEQWVLRGRGPVTIGKRSECNLQLNAARVSRSHAHLIRTEHTWRLEDVGSTNGTRVNGQRINCHDLRPDDKIQIGEYQLRYAVESIDDTPVQAVLLDDDQLEWVDESLCCDGCSKPLPQGARYCTTCGIDIKTGRPLVTSISKERDEVRLEARKLLWLPSWPIFVGLAPVASEAQTFHKPIATWVIVVVTSIVSLWFLVLIANNSPSMQQHKDLMLWSGSGGPEAETIEDLYTQTSFGDTAAYEIKKQELAGRVPDNRLVLEAHLALDTDQQVMGQFQLTQLFTHMLLHGGLGHLLGNLLFMLIMGMRVNGLIGNWAMAGVYILCGIGAGLVHMMATASGVHAAMLGASGAISGLAGIYLVFFPVQHMFMAAWIRPWFVLVPVLFLWVFRVRGFWVVLFFTGMDIYNIASGVEGDVAHWAHIGGFLTGVMLAVSMLILRMVNAQGDLISVVFGRAAWKLLGRPGDRRHGPGLGIDQWVKKLRAAMG